MGRARWGLGLLIAAGLVLVPTVSWAQEVGPPGDQLAQESLCDRLPEPFGASCSVVSDPTGALGDAAGAIAGQAAGSVAGSITDWAAEGAGWLLSQLAGVLERVTSPELGATWFAAHYRSMVALAGVVAFPVLLAALISAVLHQDPRRLGRALAALPLAGLLASTAVSFVGIGLVITDELSVFVARSAGAEASQMLTDVGAALGESRSAVAGLFAVFLASVVIALSSLAIWLVLLARTAAIYAAVLFLPLAMAGVIWPVTAQWAKRLVHLLVALVASKFVIAAILSLAASGLSASGSEGGFSAIIAGAALLGVAAVSPIYLLRMVPIVDANVSSTLDARRMGAPALATSPIGGGRWMVQQAQAALSREKTSIALREGTSGGGATVVAAARAASSRATQFPARAGEASEPAPRPTTPSSPTMAPRPPRTNPGPTEGGGRGAR